MLKIFFWLLLLFNIGLFAMQQGYLDKTGLKHSGREPARLLNQIQTDKIKLIPATELAQQALAAKANEDRASNTNSASSAATSTSSVAAASVYSCTEIGNFTAAEARRFASQLAELAPSIKPTRREVQEIGSYRVYLPSFGSQDNANKKGEELLGMGINDFFVIQDAPPLRYGISLGTFKTDEASRTQVAHLEEKGLTGMRVEARKSTFGKIAFQLRTLTTQNHTQFEKVAASFANKEIRDCEAPAPD
ncbi:SPOR domain-containing protein [Glaciimonas immobilis]|uniref:SPOR domain-containing protein n=1 Tax=Glaciimonas immobilis TaxID=728004 RepID=A0A840RSI4_9BURK|nr:SPOR domain-containing protein [Glaciimonas immobilis]KAF3997115.1 SPOR domain-containing protein [Glaciimonas immobilis]MBB5199978.1 hypothetical protein [Glaciimonas immobilis]